MWNARNNQCDQKWNIKKPRNFQKLPKKYSQQFVQKMDVFKRAKRVNTPLGYFCNKMFHQELSEIAQSSHTGYNEWLGNLSLCFRRKSSVQLAYSLSPHYACQCCLTLMQLRFFNHADWVPRWLHCFLRFGHYLHWKFAYHLNIFAKAGSKLCQTLNSPAKYWTKRSIGVVLGIRTPLLV